MTNERAPSVLWEVGMDLTNYPGGANTNVIPGGATENGMLLWQNVVNEAYGTQGGLDGIAAHEDEYLGVVVGNQFGTNANTINVATGTVGVEEGGGSSTGSTHETLVALEHQLQNEQEEVGNEIRLVGNVHTSWAVQQPQGISNDVFCQYII